jgi:hypothetical protein
MKKPCTVCQSEIPAARIKALPNTSTCVACSTEIKWSGVQVINHKTGNEVEVVKDPEAAKEFKRLSTRAGFGTVRGMATSKTNSNKNLYSSMPVKSFEASKEVYHSIGERAMLQMEIYNLDNAIKYVMEQYTTRAISDSQRCSIINILCEFAKPATVPATKSQKKYNPYGKYELPTPKGIVSKEIENAFRHWKK